MNNFSQDSWSSGWKTEGNCGKEREKKWDIKYQMMWNPWDCDAEKNY
jgi:hypothetical protein